jgi:hypothetical protein
MCGITCKTRPKKKESSFLGLSLLEDEDSINWTESRECRGDAG